MISNTIDCRFCSLVSKANKEDPIGTAITCDHWLIMEAPQPWPQEIYQQNPTIKSLISAYQELVFKYKIQLKPVLIAPDREYSEPGLTRILYYYRPAHLFSKFEKQEFIVPENQAAALVTAIFQQLIQKPNNLSDFQKYQQQTSHIRELMICTHAQVDLACGRFGNPLYRQLRKQYAPISNGNLRVWQSSHFGGHQFAPTLIDLPQGYFWGHLESSVLDLLVEQNNSVLGLRPYYRGWAGLNQLEQIAEREIWMQFGWSWLNYLKAGKVLAMEKVAEECQPDWAEVQIDFIDPHTQTKGSYQVRIETCGEVMSACNSATVMELEPVKQYRVSQLVRLE
ncbi:sucrase ferredoxin [Nostoc spongiaeforme FACHB-130]|uniref:Sucrase ferredoxin n=1 Tax=Nostoc spongiaeforme FACHB-130 TaxID=1357510 RepID=A0ABR8FPN0_9NOSO|nr:sucrase ferredoxin [Nostoc spongiaeforme]MBD2592910.1 sucrase ferredoxin [Nostoc spongiaeforme FACHB-130]